MNTPLSWQLSAALVIAEEYIVVTHEDFEEGLNCFLHRWNILSYSTSK